MVENKKLSIYEYYFNILELMLSDMSEITLTDIHDIMDEMNEELDKIKDN